jgi:hypothetical protein
MVFLLSGGAGPASCSLQDIPRVCNSFCAREAFSRKRESIAVSRVSSWRGFEGWMQEVTSGITTLDITIFASGQRRAIAAGSPYRFKEIGFMDENV